MLSAQTKKWARFGGWLGAALVVLWVLAWWLVPVVVQSQLQQRASEALGRKVTVGKVVFAPWSLELTLHDLAVATKDASRAQLSVRRIHADADIQSLLRLAPVLDALEIDEPVLHLALAQAGHHDLEDVLERFSAPAKAPAADQPLRFALYNIAVRGAAVDVQDGAAQRTHTVRDLELTIPFLSSLPTQREIKVEPRLAFKLNASAFASTAESTPFDAHRKTQAHMQLEGLDLAPLGAYIPKGLPIRLQAGVLDAELTLAFEQQAQAALHLRGVLKARGVRLAGSQGQTLLDLETAQVQVADMEPLAGRLTVSSVQAVVQALALDWASAAPAPRLQGRIDAALDVAWGGGAANAQIDHVALDGWALACPPPVVCAGAGVPGLVLEGKNSWAHIKSVRVDKAALDLQKRTVRAERVAVVQPQAMVERNAQGRWMFEQWLGGAGAAAPTLPQGAAQPPWDIQWGALEVDDGALALRDAQPGRPVSLNVAGLRLRLSDFALHGSKPAALELAASVAARRGEPGRLEYAGTLALEPLATQGQLRATRLPLHALEPYVAQALNVRVLRADGSFHGMVHAALAGAGPALRVQGDAALEDVRVRSAALTRVSAAQEAEQPRGLAVQDDLLRWKNLGLRGVDVALAPGQPTRVQVGETALSDFFARIIVQESGRINLQDVLVTPVQPPQADTAPAQATAAQAASAAQPAASVAAAGTAPVALAPELRFGPMALTGGTVHFSDFFIRPNYSADLSDLTGRLSAFASANTSAEAGAQLADLELRGRAEGTAQLEITGKLNPLAQPLALDITGRMQDLELPPLSPYAIKYAGHGIERGKLSMDVHYNIQPNGQLSASNKLVLKQLAFGDPVPGAKANLPVRLAVALLADRNGVIDLDLPISGSLNDPQFSLGSVIVKVIGNLIMKAVTAPFSLLASALGGTQTMDAIAFAPGSAELDAAAQQGLDKIAQALNDRPALSLTVVGEALLAAERDGWKQGQLQKLLLAQKRRMMAREGRNADDSATVAPITPQEADALLKEVYQRAEITKPRNLVGLAKDLPPAEMRALLLASMAVPEDAMRALAVARGVAVRDYLAARQIGTARLFLGAVQTQPQAEAWSPRARLELALK